MSPEEVLSRISADATVSIEDILDETGSINLQKAYKEGTIRGVKKLKVRQGPPITITSVDEDGEVVEHQVPSWREVQVDMVNRQEALRDLGRAYGLFKDNVNVNGAMTLLTADEQAKLDEEAKREAEEELEQWQQSRTD